MQQHQQNNKYEQYIEISYIIFLGILLGAILTLGMFVAPSIFNSEYIFSQTILSHFQEGLIMTSIFLKFNILLYIAIVIILLFEGYKYKRGERGEIFLFSTIFIVISTSLLFTDYYTPQILEFQSLQDTESKIFQNLHFASELDFKILAIALLILIVKRLMKLSKS